MARSYRRGISVRRVPQYVACALFILLCAAMLNAQSARHDRGPRPGPSGAGGPFPGSSARSQHVFAGALNKFKKDDSASDTIENTGADKTKTGLVIAMEKHKWNPSDKKIR